MVAGLAGREHETMARKAVITGGAGFIGSHLADRLVSSGVEVVVLDNMSTGHSKNLGRGVRLVEGDAADPDAVKECVSGADVVYHLAAIASVQAGIDNPLQSHAACGTSALVVGDTARRAGVRRLVYAASASAYGIPKSPVQSEEDPLSPRSTYAAAKLAGELHLMALGQTHGLETVRLRFFNVFGPRQRPDSPYSGVIALFANALLAGKQPTVLGDGLQTRDFVHVSDVVSALVAAGEVKEADGAVCNIGTGRATTLIELLASLGDILGIKPSPEFGPARQGDIRHSCANISRAKQLLGYQPAVSLRDGLADTIAWMRARP